MFVLSVLDLEKKLEGGLGGCWTNERVPREINRHINQPPKPYHNERTCFLKYRIGELKRKKQDKTKLIIKRIKCGP